MSKVLKTFTVEISDPFPLRDQTDPRHCHGITCSKRTRSIANKEIAISLVVSRFKNNSADLPLIDVRSISSTF